MAKKKARTEIFKTKKDRASDFPEVSKDLQLAGVEGDIDIFRDEYGIPTSGRKMPVMRFSARDFSRRRTGSGIWIMTAAGHTAAGPIPRLTSEGFSG
jgi:hypothetical protein